MQFIPLSKVADSQSSSLVKSPKMTSATVSTPLSRQQCHQLSHPHFSPKLRPSQTPRPNSNIETSPNYFNLVVDSTKSSISSGAGSHARGNFSPTSSRVRSIAATSPTVMPLDQKLDLEAFRKQADLRSRDTLAQFSLPSSSATHSPGHSSFPFPPPITSQPAVQSSTSLIQDAQRSPKRHLSTPNGDITDRPRRHSPAGFTGRDAAAAPSIALQKLSNDSNKNPSCPLPLKSLQPSPSIMGSKAQTLPTGSSDSASFASTSHIATILSAHADQVLLLDLRVSAQYSRSYIKGALNLCLPTTLLKRPMYDTRKLADSFKVGSDNRFKFENWKSCRYIVVYDNSSSILKDAQHCTNMLKKFAQNDTWTGTMYIIRGGFHDFAQQFPRLIQLPSTSSAARGSDSETAKVGLALVAGGCPIPATKSAANPFFGNIRQNMDLIGGVGQIPLKRPLSITGDIEELGPIPKWMKLAADETDNGKLVAEKFLSIEKAEQKRLQSALSERVAYEAKESEPACITLAGIEKGTKNRYNNIWPYEHSRVKLEAVDEGICDYVNANHIKSSLSEKRFIATQGPIPATFNDFWNVVWQQNVRVIVMLTAEYEGGQVKAHNYWKEKRYGPIRITFLSEHRASLEPEVIQHHRQRRLTSSTSKKPDDVQKPDPTALHLEQKCPDEAYVTVRRFTISREDEPFTRMREITHLQYANWPDFGAPAKPAHLLGLVEQTDSVTRSYRSGPEDDSRPVLVHCSAGCGRTGTFCTVDIVLDVLKQQNPKISAEEEEDVIEKVVRELRLQRLSMVQSLRQFVLCYETVLEWLVQQLSTP